MASFRTALDVIPGEAARCDLAFDVIPGEAARPRPGIQRPSRLSWIPDKRFALSGMTSKDQAFALSGMTAE
jgi:hypothetical protein